MALYRGANGVIAFGTGGEPTYGASTITSLGTHLIYAEEAATSKVPLVFNKNSLATGYEHGIGLTQLSDQTRLQFRGPVDDKGLPLLLAFALGTDTVSTVDTSGKLHTIGLAACNEELRSTVAAVVMGEIISNTSRQVTFAGVVVDKLHIFTSDETGMWEFEADCFTAGYNSGGSAVDVSGYLKPTLFPYTQGTTFVNFQTTSATVTPVWDPPIATLTVPLGGSGSTPANGGVAWGSTQAAFSPSVEAVDILIDNKVRGSWSGLSGNFASRAVRGQRDVTVTLRHKWDDGVATNQNLIGNAGNVAYALCIYNRQNTVASATTNYYAFGFYLNKVGPLTVSPPGGLDVRTNESVWTLHDPATTGIKPMHAFVMNTDATDYVTV